MWTLIGLVAAVIGGVLILAATKPDTFRVARDARIQAPPERVFSLIYDFKQWRAWSPWESKDAAMERTLGPVTAGKGAMYAWDGNENVGQGRMVIAEATAPSRVAIELYFVRPFKVHNLVEFTVKPEASGLTHVTWAMQGPRPYFAKILHVFINMDRMVGKDFEAGLANLKAVAER